MHEELAFIQQSFAVVERDLKKAVLHKQQYEHVYLLTRMQRLLLKLDAIRITEIENGHIQQVQYIQQVYTEIERKVARWVAQLSTVYDEQCNEDAIVMALLHALTLHQEPSYNLTFVRAILRQIGFRPEEKLELNSELVHVYNVLDVQTQLKTVRSSLMIILQHHHSYEDAAYLLKFVENMEKELNERPDLAEVLERQDEPVYMSVEQTLNELNQLIGLQQVKNKVMEISDWIMFSKLRRKEGLKSEPMSYHMVFSGNPGTGKTTIARIIAMIYRALGVLKKGHLVEVSRADLVAEYVGQTAVKTMKKIKEAEHGVLFVDEAYALTRASSSNDFGMEAIDTLVKAMEDKRDRLVVILAGYPAEMTHFMNTNPGLNSRFQYHIRFPDYSVEELMEILERMLKEKQYRMNEGAKEQVKYLIKRAIVKKPDSHGNGRLVRNLLENILLKKATYTMQQVANGEAVELDVIDEKLMMIVVAEQTKRL